MVSFVVEQKQDIFSGNGAVESALDFSQCVSATTIKVQYIQLQFCW